MLSLEPGSVIPAHEGKAQGSQVQDLPGLQSELKGRTGNLERSHLMINKSEKKAGCVCVVQGTALA